ncbi:MAG TPA: NAD(P)-binding domain-containing protein [Kofleriaceae bacterium]|nr:NAD(P)-binding domain-containing protein [Kofleriaceae bacterium]
MTWVVPLALGGFAVLLMAVFTVIAARRRHHAHTTPAQVVGPRVLVHDINDDRCTGCDACVAVCPTNVLDLVANKSRVLRFEDCIQCEACMFACPTEALVMFPEGSHPPPLKIPEMDENFQTAVPGQYLIGEVAGKPLVKNAANLGRAVVEHMLANGLRAGGLGRDAVDVAIVGSGPGGLSAALTCIQRGLSYVVLEKEQLLASTIARYPKGKLVMAEPYDSENLSLLPVFDSSKEQLIPIWNELIQRVGLKIRQGESVETVQRIGDGAFEVRTTVASVRAQRVVLAIGTRGKPRTLQVPGENLPKVYSLLDDPDDWRGRNVLVVGGGDSACEAALALADAGAKVIISYRGKGFNRAAPKNKQTIEQYASEGRIKAKLQSQVLQFDDESVTLALGDGSQKRYPNDGAFVLIGADPPVAWLEKMGIRFVERPHQYQLGKSDDIVRRYVARTAECPEDAARAAAQVLGGSTGFEPVVAAAQARGKRPGSRAGSEMSGPRKWLRSATSIFSTRGGSKMTPLPIAPARRDGGRKKLDGPVPLSEFAKRQKTSHTHTGHGRRDQLSAGERTRILRMLRDEGGRLADVDDAEDPLYIGRAPSQQARYEFDFDDDDAPAPPRRRPPTNIHEIPQPPPPSRGDVPAKPAVVVGLAQANSRRGKRQSGAPAPRGKPPSVPPPAPRTKPPTAPPPRRAPLPSPFNEPTRAVNDAELIAAVRAAAGPGRIAPEDPTRMSQIENTIPEPALVDPGGAPKFLPVETELASMRFDEPDEATQLASVDVEKLAKLERARQAGAKNPNQNPNQNDERTRAVDIRNDRSMSDIDWDID